MLENTYEADEEDAAWLESADCTTNQLDMDEFEEIIQNIETNSRLTVVAYARAITLNPKFTMAKVALVYDYWLKKRTVRNQCVACKCFTSVSAYTKNDRSRMRYAYGAID